MIARIVKRGDGYWYAEVWDSFTFDGIGPNFNTWYGWEFKKDYCRCVSEKQAMARLIEYTKQKFGDKDDKRIIVRSRWFWTRKSIMELENAIVD